jgi:AMP nucleosidase
MVDRLQITKNWLPRYTGMPLDNFGEYILLTNFRHYVDMFAEMFSCDIQGESKPMQAATNSDGLTIVNFGIGSANAATIMDLLSAIQPKGVLFLGKCGGLKKSSEIGHFILPNAAIRGEGTSNDYFPAYRTGVVYSTNRRIWEHDQDFMEKLQKMTSIGIDMETATIFIVGHYNVIARGALLLVSDVPLTPEGVKTEESDLIVTQRWADSHLKIGIDAMTEIGEKGERIKHFQY